MMKTLFLLALLGLLALRPAVAQTETAAPPPPAAPALSAAEAQRALDVLQDPQKREQLIATLRAIAVTAPSSLGELAGINGVGESKLAKYGEAILGVLAPKN